MEVLLITITKSFFSLGPVDILNLLPPQDAAASWAQCYKTFYGRNLLNFIIS
jgi:hypothetical protein